MEALLLRAEDVASVLGISRSAAYSLIARGEVPSVRVGASRRVPAEGLKEYVDQLSREADGVPAA
jgi:excisionase family DNA binding protein